MQKGRLGLFEAAIFATIPLAGLWLAKREDLIKPRATMAFASSSRRKVLRRWLACIAVVKRMQIV
jgi:hypothetical protein